MTTNAILATLTIVGSLVTNWTGTYIDNKEIGLIKTNVVGYVEYEGKLHQLLLSSEDTGQHVWRTNNIITFTSPWYDEIILPSQIYTNKN